MGDSNLNYCNEIITSINTAKKLVGSKKFSGLLIGKDLIFHQLNGMTRTWVVTQWIILNRQMCFLAVYRRIFISEYNQKHFPKQRQRDN